MNRKNRNELKKAIEIIESAKEIVELMCEEEQGKFDNLSEGLQATERGQKFEENVSALDDVSYNLDEAINNLNTAIE
jgi:hypothetical protein